MWGNILTHIGVHHTGTWRQSRMRIYFPFKEMMAEPVPKIGMNELLPIRTCCPEHGRYDINTDLSGIIWSVAPVSATKRLE
jgi:hypothetical protein